MNILLYIRIILWYFDGSDKLNKDWVGMIDSLKNNIFYSSISTALICLKHSTSQSILNNFYFMTSDENIRKI